MARPRTCPESRRDLPLKSTNGWQEPKWFLDPPCDLPTGCSFAQVAEGEADLETTEDVEMAKAKQVVAWPEGCDPLSSEERAEKRAAGKARAEQLKREAGRHKDLARRERKVQKLNTMGADATPEKKRMRTVTYKGAATAAGTAWNPNGKRHAK
jgi:hypothetical protein